MKNEIMNEKVKIADILKIFKKLISLHGDKIKDLSSYEYYFEDIEEDIEDEDENDLDYLKTLHFNLVQQFGNFLIEYNIDDTPKEPAINKREPAINKREPTNKKESAINKKNNN